MQTWQSFYYKLWINFLYATKKSASQDVVIMSIRWNFFVTVMGTTESDFVWRWPNWIQLCNSISYSHNSGWLTSLFITIFNFIQIDKSYSYVPFIINALLPDLRVKYKSQSSPEMSYDHVTMLLSWLLEQVNRSIHEVWLPTKTSRRGWVIRITAADEIKLDDLLCFPFEMTDTGEGDVMH